MIEKLPYRPGIGVMLMNEDKHIFVAKRIDMTSEAWQMPQGGIDEGEDPVTAMWRELGEEIGTNKATLIAESKDWYDYDLPDALVPIIWGGRFRGQRQKWFLLRFDGTDKDINIVTAHPEFSEWKWVKPELLPEVIVPFKKKLYQKLVEEFLPFIQGR
jgi:putative (di)nucleoside polyphosphate hydrolase